MKTTAMMAHKESGEAIMDFVLKVRSGAIPAKAELLAQDDFIAWKRGVSL